LQKDEYVSFESVTDELHEVLSCNPRLDFVTLSGSGEPTLHSGIGEIIRFLKLDYPQYKVALLTNGTLFNDPHVRKAIVEVDVVKASMDAGSEKHFFHINRPHQDLNFTAIIDGLVAFRKQYHNKYLIEVFFIPDINDSPDSLKQIKRMLGMIHPDSVQLNTLDRPGAVIDLKPVGPSFLQKASLYLEHAQIINYCDRETKTQDIDKGYFQRLLSALRRRPMTAEDISNMSGIEIGDAYSQLEELVKNGKIEKTCLNRGTFYVFKP
jgi:wyosine [tRNA(Phe)-imidazoG37] synthetase (radical SAM superfamily)